MKNKGKIVLIALIIFCALAFVTASIYLVIRAVQGADNNNEYNEIASSFASNISETEDSTTITSPTDIDVKKAENPIDFNSLTEKNSDIYSWLYIPETNVNYPVCRHSLDDNFYLEHDIYKNYSFAGAIYSQFCNSKDYRDRVTVLYGHNMADGSMFADLHKFKDKDFFDKTRYFYIYTENRKLTYEVVSAFVYDDRHIMNTFDFSDDEVFADYLEMIQNPHSMTYNVREGVELDINDKIVVLSTCLNSGEGRYLVQGVLTNDEPTE